MTESRYSTGGLEPRYTIERVDGRPIPSERRFPLVLDIAGSDPHALAAFRAYADSVEADNPQLAADIRRGLADPLSVPAQHRYAP
jgi:hypothetical protein